MKKIIIVDPDEQVASILEQKLKHESIDAVSFSDPHPALKEASAAGADLVVSEISFPESTGTGLELLQRLKMNPATRNIPFVFLSSSRDVEEKVLALGIGAEAVFAKPIRIKEIIGKIKTLLDVEEAEPERASAGSEEGVLEGDLANISVIDILNIVAENRASAEIRLSSSFEKEGAVFFDSGSIVRAETSGSGNKNGMEELYKMISWLDGIFTVTYKNADAERNILIPHEKILEKAVEWFNEYSSYLHSVPPVDTVVFLDFAKFTEEMNRLPDEVSSVIKNVGENGTRIRELIEVCGHDRKQTAGLIKQLFDLSVLSVERAGNEAVMPKDPEWFRPEGQTGEEKNAALEPQAEEKAVEIQVYEPAEAEGSGFVAEAAEKPAEKVPETDKIMPDTDSEPEDDEESVPKKKSKTALVIISAIVLAVAVFVVIKLL